MAQARFILLRALTPIQKWAQKIGNPEPRITQQFVDACAPQLQDGDLLFSRENWKITNPLIPGFWGHIGIYYKGFVIEAISGGVHAEPVLRWLYQKDSVSVKRFPYDVECRKLVASAADSFVGRAGYDFLFQPGTDSFYCSELIVYAHNSIVDVDLMENVDSFGVKYSTPQMVYDIPMLIGIIEEINN